MIRISDAEADIIKEIVLDYLQGEALDIVQLRLTIQCTKFNRNCKDIFQSIVLKTENDEFIPAILASLGIKKIENEDNSDYYEQLLKNSATLYDLLVTLYHDGHYHVDYLLKQVSNTRVKRNWLYSFVLGSLVSVATGSLAYFKAQYLTLVTDWLQKSFPLALTWLGRTFSTLKNIPLLGIVYNGLMLTWQWYHTFIHGTSLTLHRVLSLLFNTLATSFTITAYVLCYLSAGVMSSVAGGLFVASATVGALKSLFVLIVNTSQTKYSPSQVDRTNWVIAAEKTRDDNLRSRMVKTALVNLFAACLTTLAVAVWCFCPPNFLFVVSCVTFMMLTTLIKQTWIGNIHERAANSLQDSLQKLRQTRSIELCPSTHYPLHKLIEKDKILTEKESQLQQKEENIATQRCNLALREQALIMALTALEKGQSSPAKALRALQQPQAQDNLVNKEVYQHVPYECSRQEHISRFDLEKEKESCNDEAHNYSSLTSNM